MRELWIGTVVLMITRAETLRSFGLIDRIDLGVIGPKRTTRSPRLQVSVGTAPTCRVPGCGQR